MNLKWMGAILVMTGCGGFGFYLSRNLGKEIRALTDFLSALGYLASDLSCRLTPLSESIRKSVTNQSGCVEKVFLNLAEELDSQISPDVSGCMAVAMSKIKDLPSRTSSHLLELGNLLGVFDMEGQQKGLQSIMSDCQWELDELRENRKQRARNYQTLGICAGLALAILLI